jgi:hypothetical protein
MIGFLRHWGYKVGYQATQTGTSVIYQKDRRTEKKISTVKVKNQERYGPRLKRLPHVVQDATMHLPTPPSPQLHHLGRAFVTAIDPGDE